MKHKVLIIGKVPPPIGGVTIHVQRLIDNLDKIAFDYIFIPLSLRNLFLSFYKIFFVRYIHLHSSNPYFKFVISVICYLCFKKLILTNHGNLGRYGNFKDSLDLFAIRLCYLPILLNDESLSIAKKYNLNSKIISSFIPPVTKSSLSPSIEQKIMDLKNKVNSLCCTNGSGMQLDSLGNDIYGIEELISCFNLDSKCGLVISDPTGGFKKKFSEFSNDNIIFISEEHSYFEVLKLSDVSIRNTTTDGDALSIKESLYLEKRTLATNCVSRPNGTVLYDMFSLDLINGAKPNIKESLSGFSNLLEIYNV